MKHSFVYIAAVAAAGLLAISAYTGCASDDANNGGGNNAGGSSQAGTGGSNNGGSNNGGSSNGGSNNGGSNNGGSSQAGTGGSGQGGGSSCAPGEASSVKNVADGTSADKVQVDIKGAIAETSKLLISKSKKGSCLWGAFVKDSAEDFGTMIVSYGDNAVDNKCPEGTDLIPNDLAPGDVVDFVGEVSSYKASTCEATVPAQKQVRICSFEKKSSGTPPTPVTVNATDLTSGDAKYQGLLVKVEGVDAENWPKNDAGKGGTVGPYGVIKLKTSGLEIHDKFYYKKDGAPQFDDSQHFNAIVGISHLDFCTWVLQPRDKCKDLDPASKDCGNL